MGTRKSKGAPKAIQKQGHKFPRLKKNLADGGYRGSLGDWVMEKCGWVVEFVLWPDECPTKFQTLQKQWIVVLSFSWLENFRRLTIDYEYLANTAETMAQLEIVFYCHILDKSCIQSSNLPVRYTNLPAHIFPQQ